MSLFDGASFSAAQDGLGFTLGAGYDIGFGGRFGLTPYADFNYGGARIKGCVKREATYLCAEI